MSIIWNRTVTLPLWLAIPIFGLALWALLSRILVPSVRWVIRRRVNALVDELNKRLPIRVQPFKLTKRKILVDRLIYDAGVQDAAAEFGQNHDMPRDLVMQKVEKYAREIVPAFNAYFYCGSWKVASIRLCLRQLRYPCFGQ